MRLTSPQFIKFRGGNFQSVETVVLQIRAAVFGIVATMHGEAGSAGRVAARGRKVAGGVMRLNIFTNLFETDVVPTISVLFTKSIYPPR